jgi:hypothetical protein
MADKPTEHDVSFQFALIDDLEANWQVLDKVKRTGAQKRPLRTNEEITADAERKAEALLKEQERIAHDSTRLIDVVPPIPTPLMKLSRNSTLPISVSAVKVVGVQQTRPSFLKSVLAPLHTPPPAPPQTLQTIIETTDAVTKNLLSFGIFDPSKFSVEFDRAASPLAGENDVDITIHVREKPRFAAKTGTWAGDGEATAQMSARAENLFGGRERIEGVLEAGTRTRNAWEVKMQSPIAARSDIQGEISVFGIMRNYKFFAGHELMQRGGHLKLKVYLLV